MKEIPTYTVDWGFGVSSEGYVGKFFRLLLSVIWVKVILRVAKRYLNVFFCFVQTFTVSNRVKQKQEGIPKKAASWLSLGVHEPQRPQRESQHGFPSLTVVPVSWGLSQSYLLSCWVIGNPSIPGWVLEVLFVRFLFVDCTLVLAKYIWLSAIM